jgi:hypothetical protein
VSVESGLGRTVARQIVQRGQPFVKGTTAERIEALWLDVCGPIERDDRRWPTQTLRDHLNARGVAAASVLDANQCRQLYRTETLSTAQADEYATAAGRGPEQVWDGWFEDEEMTA